MKKKILAATIALSLGVSSLGLAADSFRDVKPGAWYYDYVIKAAEMGIIDGYKDGTFKPDAGITRAQLAKIIVEYDNNVHDELVNAIKESSSDEQATINAVANAIPSTVKIEAFSGTGSGFFVKSNYIMTNSHVVGTNKKVQVTMANGEKIEGVVIATDAAKDIALVKVNTVSSFLKLSTELHVGQHAIAIGNPIGIDEVVTKGIVSKLNITNVKASNMFQLDTPINPGNSGGAVINSEGEVIGMATAKVVSTEVEGIAIAIRSADLLNYIQAYAK